MMEQGTKITVVLAIFAVLVAGPAAAAEKVTYEKDVKKIITERCLSCHGSDSPSIEAFKKDEKGFKAAMKGPRMDTYANLKVFVNGSDTGALMRRLDDGKSTKSGKPGNMFTHLGDSDAERVKNLAVIKKWVGGWTLKRKKEITAEEQKAIKALQK